MAVVVLLLLLLQTKGGGEGGEDHPIRPVPEPWDLEQPGEGGEEAPCTVRSVGSECLYPQDFYEETNRVHNDTKTFYACRKWCHENHRREGGSKPSLCGELVYDFKYNKTIRIKIKQKLFIFIICCVSFSSSPGTPSASSTRRPTAARPEAAPAEEEGRTAPVSWPCPPPAGWPPSAGWRAPAAWGRSWASPPG